MADQLLEIKAKIEVQTLGLFGVGNFLSLC